MKGSASEKVEGGKLVKIKVEFNGKVRYVQILGDFFIHPEDSLENIEKGLVGVSVNESEENIINKIKEIVHSDNIQLIGITPESIARVLKKATMVG